MPDVPTQPTPTEPTANHTTNADVSARAFEGLPGSRGALPFQFDEARLPRHGTPQVWDRYLGTYDTDQLGSESREGLRHSSLQAPQSLCGPRDEPHFDGRYPPFSATAAS